VVSSSLSEVFEYMKNLFSQLLDDIYAFLSLFPNLVEGSLLTLQEEIELRIAFVESDIRALSSEINSPPSPVCKRIKLCA
jgi:hypothetical protein